MFLMLRRLSRQIGRIPSLFFAALYLALIPGFAFIYYSLPGQFYHSTAQYEGEFNVESTFLMEKLAYEIGDYFRRFYGVTEISCKGWLIDSTFFRVNELRANVNHTVSFRFWFFPHAEDKVMLSGLSLPMTMAVERLPSKFEMATAGGIYTEMRDLKVDLEPWQWGMFNPAILFPCAQPEGSMNNVDQVKSEERRPLIVPLSPDTGSGIALFSAAAQGFPPRNESSYWRVLYLSAVTITTVGYGDIVPLTPTARFWTAVEAVLGVVVMGLFLTSLGYEISLRPEGFHPR